MILSVLDDLRRIFLFCIGKSEAPGIRVLRHIRSDVRYRKSVEFPVTWARLNPQDLYEVAAYWDAAERFRLPRTDRPPHADATMHFDGIDLIPDQTVERHQIVWP